MDKLKNLEMVSLIANRIEGELAQLKMWIKANIDAVNNDDDGEGDGDGVQDDYYYSTAGSKNSDQRIDDEDQERGTSEDYTESTYDNSRDYEDQQQQLLQQTLGSVSSNFVDHHDNDQDQDHNQDIKNDEYQDQYQDQDEPEEIEIKPLIDSSYLYSSNQPSPAKPTNNFTNTNTNSSRQHSYRYHQGGLGFQSSKQLYSRNAQMQIIPLSSPRKQKQKQNQMDFPPDNDNNNFLGQQNTSTSNEEAPLHYGCNIRRCGKKFLNLNLLRRHQETVHNVLDNGSFNTSLLPELQHQQHHSKKPIKPMSTKFFKCCYCPKVFITYHKLKVHKTRQHPSVLVYACDFDNCKERFISQTTLASHKEIAHQGKLCMYCSSMYFKRSSYFNHLERVHNKCARAGCDKMFESKTALLIHKRKHTHSSANTEPGETIIMNMNMIQSQNIT